MVLLILVFYTSFSMIFVILEGLFRGFWNSTTSPSGWPWLLWGIADTKRKQAGRVRERESPPGRYSHTLPIRVCAAQRGRDFEAPDLERGIYFRGVF